MICNACKKEVPDNSTVCPSCGVPLTPVATGNPEKSGLVALLLCLFLGGLGIHRFYTGHIITGIIMLILTITVFGAFITGIWVLIDLILIVCGKFTTADGKAVNL